MAIEIISGGDYAAMYAQANAIPEPKRVLWMLDHFEVRTGGDIPVEPPADPGAEGGASSQG